MTALAAEGWGKTRIRYLRSTEISHYMMNSINKFRQHNMIKNRDKNMLPIESLWGFVTGLIAYGGGATVIAYFVFQFLGKSWLDNKFEKGLENFKHQKDIEIQKLRIEIESLLSGKIKLQERDFTILPEAWAKLNSAHKNLTFTTSAFQQYPDLRSCTKSEIDEFLVTTDFSKLTKDKIRNAADPLKVYVDVVTRRSITEVRNSIADFKDYVDVNGIFLPLALKQKFAEVAKFMWEAIVAKEVGHDSKDWKMQRESFTSLEKDIRPKIKIIEDDINDVLSSHARIRI
jgi:hypothetical protein